MKHYSPNSKPSVSIIIVNYNTKDLLLRCLDSIKKTTLNLTNPTSEVIVIDNASTDSSAALLRKLQITNYKLQIIQNKENLGFAKAVNQGAKRATGKFLFILNPDTVVKEGAIKKLFEFAKRRRDLGVAGPKLLNPDGSIQPSVYRQPSILGAIQKYFLGISHAYGKYAPKTKNPIKVDTVVGGAMLIPRRIINRAGLFDERFFMYFEDLEFCRRVRSAGLFVYYLPSTKVIHEHGASVREIPQKARKWLQDSAKLYHGTVKYYLLTAVLWLGQKWERLKKQS